MDRSEIDGRKLTPLQPHGVALVIGSVPYPEGDKRLRWRSLHPKPGRAAKSCEGLTVAEVSSLYNIERADEALKLLTRRTNAKKGAAAVFRRAPFFVTVPNRRRPRAGFTNAPICAILSAEKLSGARRAANGTQRKKLPLPLLIGGCALYMVGGGIRSSFGIMVTALSERAVVSCADASFAVANQIIKGGHFP